MWNKVEQILKQKKLSIYRLARLSGISENTLRNYRNGSEPSFVNMDKIAQALDVSLEVFSSKNAE
ncbi:helix-turn-helix domain-containing protein [Limosilactobacillus antri]|uniref:helix-turn-helix domain-containing protein n=1 Tax=Limosilactobacillus antri TaxID=227943 RepID=UPI001F597826|nr:helix-turn-helix transcriptional regulator [Limosilactobacillus antri]